MRFIFLISVFFVFSSCQKEENIVITKAPLEVDYMQRSQRMAQVQNYFTKLIGNSATSTLLAPEIYGPEYRFNSPSTISCIETTLLPNENNPIALQIDFDTLAGGTSPCILPNGSKMHGTLYWDLNFNDAVTTTRECNPGFLGFNRLYIDGCIIEEIKPTSVKSPKFFYHSGCPSDNPDSLMMVANAADSNLDLTFKVGSPFHYKITTEDGAVTEIDPVSSSGTFAKLSTTNDFDLDLNIEDLYNRTYNLDLLGGADAMTTAFPYTHAFSYNAGNTSGVPDDQFTIVTTESLVYSPFLCKNITSGILEIRNYNLSATGMPSGGDVIEQTIDFGVDENGVSSDACDNYVKICDYTGASVVCEVVNCLPL